MMQSNDVICPFTNPEQYTPPPISIDRKERATVIFDNEEAQAPLDVYLMPPQKKKYNATWGILWTGEDTKGASIMSQAKMEKPLTQTEYRVRDYIIGYIGIGNYVHVNLAHVGRELRVARQDVHKAVKRLLELQILIKGPKSGRATTYMVNPSFCFSGGIGNGIKQKATAEKKMEQGQLLHFDDFRK